MIVIDEQRSVTWLQPLYSMCRSLIELYFDRSNFKRLSICVLFVMLQVDQEDGEDTISSSGEGSGRGETGGLLPPFPPPPPGPDGMSVLDH